MLKNLMFYNGLHYLNSLDKFYLSSQLIYQVQLNSITISPSQNDGTFWNADANV